MRRLARHLFTLCSAVSLFAGLSAIALWIAADRSASPPQWIGIRVTEGGSEYDLLAEPDTLTLLRPTPEGGGEAVASVTYWSTAAAFGLLPSLRLIAAVTSRRPTRAGRCPNCGYDLLATPGRCPECGTAMA